MPSGLIVAIDQGTTNTKALLVDHSGAPVFHTSAPVALIHTALGHVEQDAEQLWLSVRKVVSECVRHASQTGHAIEALGISNQRETAVAWDAATGDPIANAISWQCTRSAEICDRVRASAIAIRTRTGLPLATLISAGKWSWLIENNTLAQALARAGQLRFGTVDSWLMHRLTGGATHATDYSNASRTGLLNLEQLTWDVELLRLFAIPVAAMPDLRSSSGRFGVCSSIAELSGVPIMAAIGDSHAAMFGHGKFTPGTVKATYGTGSSLMALTPALAADTPELARTIAWSIAGKTQFALEGNIAMTGSAVQWVGDFLHLESPAPAAAALATTVASAGGVYFVPAMAGLGAPHWDAAARGTVCGLGYAHNSAHVARAAIDAIAYQVTDVFYAMEQASGIALPALQADGGASRNTALMQFQADILGLPVLRSANEELSAMGAGWLAGLALGWWQSLEEIAQLPRATEQFIPSMIDDERARLYAGWKLAVRRARLSEAAIA